MKIAVTTVTQTANEILGVEAKNLYYLIVSNNNGNKLVINIGKKTHDNVTALVENEILQNTEFRVPTGHPGDEHKRKGGK